ncbi:MAG: hypothetical protein A2033_14520 [Bacteroidetes bacterium GWA2_31_9]|nr:MAG: hypothetical protein A2033_14520 [Bacteroidetes bacterium GWA2_31_9]
MKKTIKLYLLIALLTISNLQSQELNLMKNSTNLTKYSLIALSINAEPSSFNLLSYNSKTIKPRLRNTGIVFTIMGAVFIAGGIAMVNSADGVTYYYSNTYNGHTTTEGDATGAFGALGIVGGSIAMLGGGTMWFFGSRKLKKGGHRTALNFSPSSVYLTYNF